MHDITDLKRAEETLQRQFYHALLLKQITDSETANAERSRRIPQCWNE